MTKREKSAYLSTERKWPNFIILYQDGSRKRFAKHVTIDKATDLLREMNNRIELGTFSIEDYTRVKASYIQLGKAAVEYVDSRVRRVQLGSISGRTLEKDEDTLILFIQVVGKESHLAAFQRSDIEKFAVTLRTEKKTQYGKSYANASIRSYLKALSSFFSWAKEKGYVVENPVRRILGKMGKYGETEQVKFCTPAQVAMLRAEMAKRPVWVADAFNFALWTGARVSEVMNLKKNDVYLIEKNGKSRTVVQLRGKGGKVRIVPVGDECALMIRQRLTSLEDSGRLNAAKKNAKNQRAVQQMVKRFEEGFLFWEISHRKTISEAVCESRRALGIEEKIMFHGARHTYATESLKQGVDLKVISSLLGHSEVRTTEVYAKVLEETLLAATEELVSI